MHKFTVLWGNIGDSTAKRLDHVEVAEPTFEAIMDAVFRLVQDESCDPDDELWADIRHNTPYDGYAIFDGHLHESPISRFY